MVSSVKSRPNHYQTLGLSPTASDQEIAAAFSRAMSAFGARSITGAAQIGAAFEVLRNPTRRRAYDRALGLTSEPKPYQWPITANVRSNGGFVGSAWTNLAKQVASEEPPTPPRRPDLQARLEKGAEPKIASFIASSLREPEHPRISELVAKPAPAQNRERESDAALEQHLAQLLSVRNSGDDNAFGGDVRTLEWKRPALALGGLIVAAGLIGTLGGLWVRGGQEDLPQPEAVSSVAAHETQTNSVTVAVPTPETLQPVSQPQPQPRVPAKIAMVRHQVVAPPPAATAAPVAEASQPAIVPTTEQLQAASEQLAADPLAPAPADAKMPLPNGTIARTIEKIGYSCGTVASVASLEKPGVFKVSCSSGQNYQATPVNGRYHFRKMGGR